MDWTKRWAAGMLLSEANFLLTHAASTMMRCANWYKDGMNEKEREYFEKRIDRLEVTRNELHKLSRRFISTSDLGRLGAP